MEKEMEHEIETGVTYGFVDYVSQISTVVWAKLF